MNDFDPVKGRVLPLGMNADGTMTAMFCDGKGVVPLTMSPATEGGGGSYFCEIQGPSEKGPGFEAELIPMLGQGPPKVNSKAYQEGWDAIFGDKGD